MPSAIRLRLAAWLALAGILLLPIMGLALDPRVATLLQNTAALCAGTLAISLPLGMVSAVLLVRTDLPGRRVFLAALTLALFIPLYLHAAGWQAGFGLQGWYTSIFIAPGGTPWLAGWRGAIWIHAMAAVPWVTLIVGLGLQLVEPELEEDALLCASGPKVFWHVAFPRALPAVLGACFWVAVLVSGEMTVTDLFRVRTYAEELYTGFALGDPSAAQLGTWPVVVATTVLLLVAVGGLGEFTERGQVLVARQPVRYELKHWTWPALLLMLLVTLLVLGAPVANLAYWSGLVVERVGDDLQRGWSPAKAMEMFVTGPWRYWDAFRGSLAICGSAATAAVLIGIPLAWLARRGGVFAFPALLLALVGLAIPGPVLALQLIEVLNTPGQPALHFLYDRTIFAPWLVQTLKALPLVLLVLWVALRSIPDELLDAAQLDGAGPLARLALVALPLRWPAILIAWLVALAVALGDLAATVLLVPPGVVTLSTQIFDLIHYGVDDRLAGICLALLALIAVLAGIGGLLLRRTASLASQSDFGDRYRVVR